MRLALPLTISLALAWPAIADPTVPDPTIQALSAMLGQAQSREATALIQVFTLQAELTKLRAETKPVPAPVAH